MKEQTGLEHDHLVVAAALPYTYQRILGWAERENVWGISRSWVEDTVPWWWDLRESLTCEPEYAVESVDAYARYVDLALCLLGEPVLLLEIKSEREAQSASAWSRQTRDYARALGVPCVLVIAHDLGKTQRKYLEFTKVPVCDLRTITKWPKCS